MGHDGAADTNGDDAHANKQSTLHRIGDWTAQHLASIILGILAVFFFALFLVTVITRLPNDGKTPSIPGPDGDKICTAAGCVLASSTLLRSISPRFAESVYDVVSLLEYLP